MSRDLRLFLEDIENACRKIVHYTDGSTREEVFSDEMRFDAVLHNLHVIGEAVKNLPNAFRERHPTVAWREIAGSRSISTFSGTRFVQTCRLFSIVCRS